MPTVRTPADVQAATRLRTLREVSGLSRAEFLRRCQTDPVDPVPWRSTDAISAIEKAHTRFPWDRVETFARALDCHPDEIRLAWVTRRQPGTG